MRYHRNRSTGRRPESISDGRLSAETEHDIPGKGRRRLHAFCESVSSLVPRIAAASSRFGVIEIRERK